MRTLFIYLLLTIVSLFFSFTVICQSEQGETAPSIKTNQLSIYFGWNRATYSNSDIHFKGEDYDFTILNVTASDRQTPFSFEKYFGIQNLTIPQTNLGFSYQYSSKVSFGLNIDHMKYILDQDQKADIDGTIGEAYPNWAGTHNNNSSVISEDLLRFEHSDGLNYINLSYTRDRLFSKKERLMTLQSNYGGSAGILLPKTNSRLLGKDRYDDFHVSGYGFALHTGLQLNIGSVLFLGTNIKAGFINMPDIKTTLEDSDSASQHFTYLQGNLVFGIRLNLNRVFNKPK